MRHSRVVVDVVHFSRLSASLLPTTGQGNALVDVRSQVIVDLILVHGQVVQLPRIFPRRLLGHLTRTRDKNVLKTILTDNNNNAA